MTILKLYWDKIVCLFIKEKDIKITPTLRGKNAVNFFKRIKSTEKIDKAKIHIMKSDAQKLRDIFKEYMMTTKEKENLKPVIKDIQELFIGFTRDDANYIFEEAIIGLYQLQSRGPYEEGKYKIVLRETGEEVNFDWRDTSLLP